jgi:hypothetical protein
MFARGKLWLAAIGAFLAALGAAYWRGWSAKGDAAKREGLEDYVETRKRMDQVDHMSDADAARDWLSDRMR